MQQNIIVQLANVKVGTLSAPDEPFVHLETFSFPFAKCYRHQRQQGLWTPSGVTSQNGRENRIHQLVNEHEMKCECLLFWVPFALQNILNMIGPHPLCVTQ